MCHHKPPFRQVTEISAMLARPAPSPQGLRPSEIALFFLPATRTPGKTKLNYTENFQWQGVLHPAADLSLEGKRATLPHSHHHLGKQPTEAGSPRPQGPLPQVLLSNMHPPNPGVCGLPLPHTGSPPHPLPVPLPCFHPPEEAQDPEKEGRGSPILEARGVVGEARAGGVDRLQLREAWGYWGATREPATATPWGHRGGVEQAALLLHLQAQGHDATPCPQAAGQGGCIRLTHFAKSRPCYSATHPTPSRHLQPVRLIKSP